MTFIAIWNNVSKVFCWSDVRINNVHCYCWCCFCCCCCCCCCYWSMSNDFHTFPSLSIATAPGWRYKTVTLINSSCYLSCTNLWIGVCIIRISFCLLTVQYLTMYVVVFLKRRKREAFPLFPVIVGLCRILSAANPVKLVDELFADTRNGRKKKLDCQIFRGRGLPCSERKPQCSKTWK